MKLKEKKQQEALIRKTTTETMTPQERIERLDKLFGPGVGAKKERARMSAAIQSQKPKNRP